MALFRSRILNASLALLFMSASFLAVIMASHQEASAGPGAGGHNHGVISCGSDSYINVTGAVALRNGSPGPGGSSRVFYRAVAYEWNGSSWVFSSASPWQMQTPFGYGIAPFKPAGFSVTRAGYYAVQTEFMWFDYRNLVFYGSSAGWASDGAYCTYR